jgi:hypothetical protein
MLRNVTLSDFSEDPGLLYPSHSQQPTAGKRPLRVNVVVSENVINGTNVPVLDTSIVFP